MSIPPSITKNTPITLHISGLIIILGATWHLSREFSKISMERDDIQRTLDRLNVATMQIQKNISNQWTYGMMKDFASELDQHNPELVVPSVPEVRDRNIQ